MTLPAIPFIDFEDNRLNRWANSVRTVFNQLSGPINWLNIGATGAPAFQNGWVNFDGGTTPSSNNRTAAFSIDAFGFVRLRGVVKGGTANSVIFTLPVGYRPRFQQTFAVNGNNAFASASAYNNGNVKQETGSTSFMFLDGMQFLAEA